MPPTALSVGREYHFAPAHERNETDTIKEKPKSSAFQECIFSFPLTSTPAGLPTKETERVVQHPMFSNLLATLLYTQISSCSVGC